MIRLTIIFEVRLSRTNPAPGQIYAFTIEANSGYALKSAYKIEVERMRRAFPNHTFFKRLVVTRDSSSLLNLADIEAPQEFDTAQNPNTELA